MKMLTTNLKLIRGAWGLSQDQFGAIFGRDRTIVQHWEGRGTMPTPYIQKQMEKIFGFSIQELTSREIAPEEIPLMPFEVQEITDSVKKKMGRKKYNTIAPNVSDGVDVLSKPKLQVGNCFYVPVKAFGGFLEGYDDVYFLSTLEKRSHPDIIGDCYAFEVEGFSMYKHKVIDGEVYESGYKPGGHVVTTPVDDFKHLVKGKDYVFVTIDGVIIKRFEKIEKEECYLISINSEYNPVRPLKLKTIKKVFYVQKRYV